MTPSVPDLVDHLTLFRASQTPSWLVSDWIRVGLIAGVVDDRVQDLSRCLCDDYEDYFVLGSLNAPLCFTEVVRESFVKKAAQTIKCDTDIAFLKERTVESLLQLRPPLFEFSLVPQSLEKAIKDHRLSSEPVLSREEILRHVPNEDKANVLWNLVEEERRQRIIFDRVRKRSGG